MKLRQMGSTGLYLSELGLGAMTFGLNRQGGFFDRIQTSIDEAERIIDRAIDAGINFIDTADVYGEGASEELLGQALKERRKRMVLATKVGGAMGEGPNRRGLSRHHIIASCDASLRRLQTDYVDLYQAHWPDARIPLEESLRAFDDLVRAGKVRYVGASNFGAYRLTKSLWTSDRRGIARYNCLQPQYSLLVRDIEDEILPMCQAEGIGVVCWGPQAQGFLSGKYHRDGKRPEGSRLASWEWVFERHDTDRQWDVVDAVRSAAEASGGTPSQVALRWVLSRPGVTSVIVGARTAEQLDQNVGAVDLGISSEALDALTEISAVRSRYPFATLSKPE